MISLFYLQISSLWPLAQINSPQTFGVIPASSYTSSTPQEYYRIGKSDNIKACLLRKGSSLSSTPQYAAEHGDAEVVSFYRSEADVLPAGGCI